NIEFIPQSYNYLKPFHINKSVRDKVTNIDIKVITDDGFCGYGQASPSLRVNGETPDIVLSLSENLKKELIGLEIKEYRNIFRIITRKIISKTIIKN
ncbi:MAG: dipeptide epimerase, partial [Spirochaetota bacterium]